MEVAGILDKLFGQRYLKSTEIYFLQRRGKDASPFTNFVEGANKANPLGIERKGKQDRGGWVGDFFFFHTLNALYCEP